MKHTVSTAIVLSRTNYSEADRIITALTPNGKIRFLAKGVRKIKSKLAGGIELFSITEITLLKGKGELQTLISGRLQSYFGNITKNIERTTAAYEVLKIVNRITEDHVEPEYYELTKKTFEALDDHKLSVDAVIVWFLVHLQDLEGKGLNLARDTKGNQLVPAESYSFSFENMCFYPGVGPFTKNHIKYLRLNLSFDNPKKVEQLVVNESVLGQTLGLLKKIVRSEY